MRGSGTVMPPHVRRTVPPQGVGEKLKDVRYKMDMGRPIISDRPLTGEEQDHYLKESRGGGGGGGSSSSATGVPNPLAHMAAETEMDEIVEEGVRRTRNVTLETCPMQHPSQNYLVLQWVSPSNPDVKVAIRASAAFKSLGSAEDHARQLAEKSPGLNTTVIEMGRMCAFPPPEEGVPKKYVLEEIDRAMRAHYEEARNVRGRHRESRRRAAEAAGRGEAGDPDPDAPETEVEFGNKGGEEGGHPPKDDDHEDAEE